MDRLSSVLNLPGAPQHQKLETKNKASKRVIIQFQCRVDCILESMMAATPPPGPVPDIK